MTPAPNRRWFRFSMRTLFVVAMTVCVALAYHLTWIWQRHRALESGIVEAMDLSDPYSPPAVPDVQAPGLLWLYGEPGYPELLLKVSRRDMEPTEAESAGLVQLKRLFPESEFVGFTWSPPPIQKQQTPIQKQQTSGSAYDGFKL